MYGAHLASLLHHSCSSTTCRWMILGASLTRCSLPACACFTDGCVPLGGGFSRCSRWSSPGWRMHLPWRSGRLEGTDLAYLTRRPLTRVRVVVCSSLAPGSRITWLGSIDLQCTVLVLDVVTSGQSWIPTYADALIDGLISRCVFVFGRLPYSRRCC